MPKAKLQKEKDLKELTDKLKTAKAVVLSDYRGTSVKDMDKFRGTLRKENVFSKVYKLTLVKRAMKDAGISGEIADYKTPVVLSISQEDETTPARAIKTLGKELKTITILEGVSDGKLVNKASVMVLADLPSKQDLRAMLVRTINAPVSGLVNVLAANIRGLLNVLNAMSQKTS